MSIKKAKTKINGCHFSSNWVRNSNSAMGGAIFLGMVFARFDQFWDGQSNHSNLFYNNSAAHGGAILISGNSEVNTNCISMFPRNDNTTLMHMLNADMDSNSPDDVACFQATILINKEGWISTEISQIRHSRLKEKAKCVVLLDF